MAKTKVQFSIEFQWNRYVQRSGIRMEQLKALPDQEREMKRAFMGGMGQMFYLLGQDATELPENEINSVFSKIESEIGLFWQLELLKHGK